MCRLLYMLIMLVFESLWHTNCVGVFRPLPEWKRQTAGKILLVSSATWQCWINFVHYAHQTVYENCGSPAHNFNVMCLEWLVDFNKVHKMFFFFPVAAEWWRDVSGNQCKVYCIRPSSFSQSVQCSLYQGWHTWWYAHTNTEAGIR